MEWSRNSKMRNNSSQIRLMATNEVEIICMQHSLSFFEIWDTFCRRGDQRSRKKLKLYIDAEFKMEEFGPPVDGV